jgi:hypothetical protein
MFAIAARVFGQQSNTPYHLRLPCALALFDWHNMFDQMQCSICIGVYAIGPQLVQPSLLPVILVTLCSQPYG